MNNVKVTMTIEKDGRWYRFVQAEDYHCVKCVFYRNCFSRSGECPISRDLGTYVKGHFERFRQTDELVRIGVRLLVRKARELYPMAYIDCHGPKYPTDSNNKIYFDVTRRPIMSYPKELIDLIERLNALGLGI